jgi:hypothetical protein
VHPMELVHEFKYRVDLLTVGQGVDYNVYRVS